MCLRESLISVLKFIVLGTWSVFQLLLNLFWRYHYKRLILKKPSYTVIKKFEQHSYLDLFEGNFTDCTMVNHHLFDTIWKNVFYFFQGILRNSKYLSGPLIIYCKALYLVFTKPPFRKKSLKEDTHGWWLEVIMHSQPYPSKQFTTNSAKVTPKGSLVTESYPNRP